MNYRPEGWGKNKIAFNKLSGRVKEFAEAYDYMYEAGADALIRALKAEGVFTYGNHTPEIYLSDAKEDSGYWCFLPDEGYSYEMPEE